MRLNPSYSTRSIFTPPTSPIRYPITTSNIPLPSNQKIKTFITPHPPIIHRRVISSIPITTTILPIQSNNIFRPKVIPSQSTNNILYSQMYPQTIKQKINNNIDDIEIFPKSLDFSSHFNVEVKKEMQNGIFPYNNIRKEFLALFGHLELPQEYDYVSPSLSQNGLFFGCIARGPEDFVLIWKINNLYCFKFKYGGLRVDSFAFTPDSKNVIIVYRFTNPVIYNLKDGNKILDLIKNGEENNRVGLHYAFTMKGKYFGYTSDNSFTMWNINSGEIKKQIKNYCPIKKICGQYIVCVDEYLNCKLIRYIDNIIDYEFKLKGIYSTDEILDCRLTLDITSFIYVIKQGIIKYNLESGEFQGIQKFKPGVIKAQISIDCKYIAKTNMKNITIYDIENQEILGSVLKEKFKDFKVDFINQKIITIDDICIDFYDYSSSRRPEKFIWLNKNPTHFIDIKFCKNNELLIGKIDNNNIIVYNTSTGKIIKKFHNNDDTFSICYEIAPISTGLTIIVTKSNKKSIKIWNYKNGREEGTLYGFDSFSFSFSNDGFSLATGTKCGIEIARIWNINSGEYKSFMFLGCNNNFHTVVNLTKNSKRLICCSVSQQPIIFNTENCELLFKCQCNFFFEELYEIQSDNIANAFLVKGRDIKKRNIGLLYRLYDGVFLDQYENYTNMEFAKNSGFLLAKSDNVNNGKLTSMDFKNMNYPIRRTCQIQADDFKILNDNKSFVTWFGNDDHIKFYVANVFNGRILAEFNYIKKTSRNAEVFFEIDLPNNELIFKYIEFLTLEDTLIYKKEHIDRYGPIDQGFPFINSIPNMCGPDITQRENNVINSQIGPMDSQIGGSMGQQNDQPGFMDNMNCGMSNFKNSTMDFRDNTMNNMQGWNNSAMCNMSDMRDKAQEYSEDAFDKMRGWKNSAVSNMGNFKDSAMDKMSDMKNNVGNYLNNLEDKANEFKNENFG